MILLLILLILQVLFMFFTKSAWNAWPTKTKEHLKRKHKIHVLCRNPTWESVRMKLTLPKYGLGSPLGLPKLQSSIPKVKTPCIEVFFISLENYQSVDVKNGLA